MQQPLIPQNEQMRIEELYASNILDTLPEQSFDELLSIAAQVCNCPTALISLVDTDRQWFKAKINMNVNETSRCVSFCAHAINQDKVMVITDTEKDIRFHDNPLVTNKPNIRFYAGAPIQSPNGYNLGTVCVIDYKPNSISEAQKQSLKDIAAQVACLIALRKENYVARQMVHHSRQIEQSLEEMFTQSTFPKLICDIETLQIIEANSSACILYGMEQEQLHQVAITDLGSGTKSFSKDRVIASLNGVKPTTLLKVKFKRKDGTSLILQINFSFLNYRGKKHALAAITDLTARDLLVKKLKKERLKTERKIIKAARLSRQHEKDAYTEVLRENINQILACAKLYISMARQSAANRLDLLEKGHDNIVLAMEEIKKLYQPLLQPDEDGYLKNNISKLIFNFELLRSFKVHFTFIGEEVLMPAELKLAIYKLLHFYFYKALQTASLKNVWLSLEVAEAHVSLIFKSDTKSISIKRRRYLAELRTTVEAIGGSVKLLEHKDDSCTLFIDLPFSQNIGVTPYITMKEKAISS